MQEEDTRRPAKNAMTNNIAPNNGMDVTIIPPITALHT